MPPSVVCIRHVKEVLDCITAAGLQFREKLQRFIEDRLVKMGQTHFRRSTQYCIAHCLRGVADIDARPKILRRQSELIRNHDAWLSMLSGLDSQKHARTLTLLQIQHFSSLFNVATCLSTTEAFTDNFTSSFNQILDLIEDYVHDAFPSERNGDLEREPRKSFSLERGLLPTLYNVCLKARVTSVWYRALELLRGANRREGLHWSGEIFTYAESIVLLEERRARELGSTSANIGELRIPEAARVLESVVEGFGYHEIRVICGRFQHERRNQLEVVEYRGHGAPPLRLQPLNAIILPLASAL